MKLKKRTIIFGFILFMALIFAAAYALSWGFTIHYLNNLHLAVFGILGGIAVSLFGKIKANSEGIASALISCVFSFGFFMLIAALPFILPDTFPHGFNISYPDGNFFYFVLQSAFIAIENAPFAVLGAVAGVYLQKRRMAPSLAVSGNKPQAA
jgi:hypothetical protein